MLKNLDVQLLSKTTISGYLPHDFQLFVFLYKYISEWQWSKRRHGGFWETASEPIARVFDDCSRCIFRPAAHSELKKCLGLQGYGTNNGSDSIQWASAGFYHSSYQKEGDTELKSTRRELIEDTADSVKIWTNILPFQKSGIPEQKVESELL